MLGNCKDCLFWKFAGALAVGSSANPRQELHGNCQLSPPVLFAAKDQTERISAFPETKSDDGCGQFQPKPDAEACPFALAYKRLAVEGKCDAPGSTEYHRVRATWIANGSPTVDGFIVREANRMP